MTKHATVFLVALPRGGDGAGGRPQLVDAALRQDNAALDERVAAT